MENKFCRKIVMKIVVVCMGLYNYALYLTGVILGCSAIVMIIVQFIAGRVISLGNIWIPVLIALLLVTAGVSLV